MRPNLLILGGTVEARSFAQQVADREYAATMSLAGRVSEPKQQAVPVRQGGFGGAQGFARFLAENNITHVVDATHPFAAQMSRNAVEGCRMAQVPLIALTRAPWKPQAGDRWTSVPSIDAAARLLAQPKRRVMLGIGRMHISAFAGTPQHFFLLRLVDHPTTDLGFPDCEVVVARGPFRDQDDLALLKQHHIDLVVSKNAGGTGAEAKIKAARELGIEVIMIDRPDLPDRLEVHSAKGVFDWLADQETDLGV